MEWQRFEWDDRKAAANLLKHKVSFLEAATVFEDPYVLVEPDSVHSAEESRELAIGFSMKERVLLVVYVELQERIRLISARRATPEERRKYESQFE
ncbi:MAG: BrnT family toxin [Terracidiphilus sp.]